jgi:hypothetical protein
MSQRAYDRIICILTGVICTLIAIAMLEVVGAQQQHDGRGKALIKLEVPCLAPDMLEKLRPLLQRGIDDAFKHRVDRLFESWMLDDRDQPFRAAVGTGKAIRAYVNSRGFIDTWSPPACPT